MWQGLIAWPSGSAFHRVKSADKLQLFLTATVENWKNFSLGLWKFTTSLFSILISLLCFCSVFSLTHIHPLPTNASFPPRLYAVCTMTSLCFLLWPWPWPSPGSRLNTGDWSREAWFCPLAVWHTRRCLQRAGRSRSLPQYLCTCVCCLWVYYFQSCFLFSRLTGP